MNANLRPKPYPLVMPFGLFSGELDILRHYQGQGFGGNGVRLDREEPTRHVHLGLFKEIANITAIAEIGRKPCRLEYALELFDRSFGEPQATAAA